MNRIEPGANILRTKQHFEILDGLRGVAALATEDKETFGYMFTFISAVYFSGYKYNYLRY